VSNEAISSHDELRGLVQRYARAADERDIDALTAIFHPDAVIQGARGTQSRTEWVDGMRGPRTHPVSMHNLSDPLIELDASGEAGTVDTYAVVYMLGDRSGGGEATPADMTLGMRYRDDVVRHEGRWVVRNRVAQNLWMR
jgi:hypothetical protein